MTDESVESVAERYARIKREADETTKRQLEAFERRLIAALNERREAEVKAVTSRPRWVRLRDWWRGMR